MNRVAVVNPRGPNFRYGFTENQTASGIKSTLQKSHSIVTAFLRNATALHNRLCIITVSATDWKPSPRYNAKAGLLSA